MIITDSPNLGGRLVRTLRGLGVTSSSGGGVTPVVPPNPGTVNGWKIPDDWWVAFVARQKEANAPSDWIKDFNIAANISKEQGDPPPAPGAVPAWIQDFVHPEWKDQGWIDQHTRRYTAPPPPPDLTVVGSSGAGGSGHSGGSSSGGNAIDQLLTSIGLPGDVAGIPISWVLGGLGIVAVGGVVLFASGPKKAVSGYRSHSRRRRS